MEPSEFWSVGDYSVVGDLWGQAGRDVAASLEVAGRDVVDLATGTGVTAIALAQRGAASVTGVDVTPVLLAEAARRAEVAGVEVAWVEADVVSVPLLDQAADVVTSTFGLVFAEDPHAAIAEARRLSRPGGLVVFTSWSPAGLFGAIRRVMAAYSPDAPAPWHESADGIKAIAGEAAEVVERTFELSVESPAVFVDLLERHSAPIVLAAQGLGERWPDARRDLLEAISQAGTNTGDGYRVQIPYLVTTLAC